jgi:acylphosphatase
MNSRRRTILYSGRVQGVGFRWTAARCVAGLAIDGYVRNLVDGRVELVMEGEPEVLDTAAERLRDAMAGQIVDEAGASGLATGEFAGFRIQH